jgi:hypothetical protein
MLYGPLARKGYDWWWHSFTGKSEKTGEEKSFFIEYYVMNPARGGDLPQFVEKGAAHPAYVMIKAGAWGKDAKQLHRFFGTNELETDPTELRIVVGDCFLSDEILKGSVNVSRNAAEEHPEYMSDAGSMSWLLRIDRRVAFDVGYGTSYPLRFLNAFGMYWHAAGMKTAYSGTVYYNGEKFTVTPETCYGYADKNWGSGFTKPWVWLSSCHLRRKGDTEYLKDTVFDFGGGRPVVFGIPIERTLLGKIRYEGREYEFNFSKFWTFTQTKFKCKADGDKVTWLVRMANKSGAIEIKAVCPKDEMLKIRYMSPSGEKTFDELWNGGTGRATVKLYKRGISGLRLIADLIADHVGCEYGEK